MLIKFEISLIRIFFNLNSFWVVNYWNFFTIYGNFGKSPLISCWKSLVKYWNFPINRLKLMENIALITFSINIQITCKSKSWAKKPFNLTYVCFLLTVQKTVLFLITRSFFDENKAFFLVLWWFWRTNTNKTLINSFTLSNSNGSSSFRFWWKFITAFPLPQFLLKHSLKYYQHTINLNKLQFLWRKFVLFWTRKTFHLFIFLILINFNKKCIKKRKTGK